MQNVVPRYQLGTTIGTANFSRNLYTTILIAVYGAIIAAGAPSGDIAGMRPGSAEAALAFSRVFLVAAASLTAAWIALLLMEQKPLQTSAEMDAGGG
jgi:hypothetical protein